MNYTLANPLAFTSLYRIVGCLALAALYVSLIPTDLSFAKEQQLLKTPEKWMQVGGDENSFSFSDGQLSLNRGDNEPADILTREDYENYELEFDCRLPDWCVSGLLLNVPRNGATRAGLEIELNNLEDKPPQLTTAGAIFRKRVPNTLAMKPRGEWNHIYVKLDWPYLFVKINDQVVQDVDLNDNWVTRNTLRRGAIGFQNLGIPMQVKNFVVRPLPNTEQNIQLFNGKDLTGWKVLKGDAKWSVRDGAIVSEGYGYLHHEWIGQDFDLRLMVRTTPISNGGVFFRWKPGSLDDRGHEIQILDVPDAVVPTGSIYHFGRTNDLALTPGKWELMQIYVRGNKVWTLVNGVNCAETEELPTVRPGYVVLQMHKDNAEVEFKDIVLVPYIEPEDDE